MARYEVSIHVQVEASSQQALTGAIKHMLDRNAYKGANIILEKRCSACGHGLIRGYDVPEDGDSGDDDVVCAICLEDAGVE